MTRRALRLWFAALTLALAPGFARSAGADVQFVDVAASVGLDFTSSGSETFSELIGNLALSHRNTGTGAAVGDYDDDGDLDLYLLGHLGQPNRLYRNDLDLGMNHFEDVTPAVLADIGFSRVAQFVDLDNDGDLDLVLLNDDNGMDDPVSRSRIFRNDGGGGFSDLSAGANFRPIGYLQAGLSLIDYDGDGFLDIYVSTWNAELGNAEPALRGVNRLYRNLGGFVFEDVSADVGLAGLRRDSFTAVFADFDEDGDRDLHVAIDHTSDEFYRNEGGSFTLDTMSVLTTHVGNDMGVACADFDLDSDLDIYATNITDPEYDEDDMGSGFGTGTGNVLYQNQLASSGSLSFVDVAEEAGVLDTYWGWGTEAPDVDNDGDEDIVAVTGFDEFVAASRPESSLLDTPSVLFLNDGTGTFTRWFGTGLDAPDDSRGLVAFDYDRDGDLDLLVTNREEPVRLFENQSTGTGHWLTLRLFPDALAIGATVRATSGGVRRRRDILAGRSYLVGTPSEVHFGLGDASEVYIEVKWADGSLQSLGLVPVDQTIDVVAVPEPCTLLLQLVALATLLGVRPRSATPWSPRLPSANSAEGPC